MSTTTSAPVLTFETTQIYLPDDFTTSDLEFINHRDAAAQDDGNVNSRYINYSPYTWNDEKKNFESVTEKWTNRRSKRESPERMGRRPVITISTSSSSRAARLRRGVPGAGATKRSLSKNDYEFERIYIQSTDLVSSLQLPASDEQLQDGDNDVKKNGTAIKTDYKSDNQIKSGNRMDGHVYSASGGAAAGTAAVSAAAGVHGNGSGELIGNASEAVPVGATDRDVTADSQAAAMNANNHQHYDKSDDNYRRVKRKSGKTTGALSRPKSDSGSSSSKSTSRKTQGK